MRSPPPLDFYFSQQITLILPHRASEKKKKHLLQTALVV